MLLGVNDSSWSDFIYCLGPEAFERVDELKVGDVTWDCHNIGVVAGFDERGHALDVDHNGFGDGSGPWTVVKRSLLKKGIADLARERFEEDEDEDED